MILCLRLQPTRAGLRSPSAAGFSIGGYWPLLRPMFPLTISKFRPIPISNRFRHSKISSR